MSTLLINEQPIELSPSLISVVGLCKHSAFQEVYSHE